MSIRDRIANWLSPPRASSNPPGRWVEFWSGRNYATGAVNEHTAMNIAAVNCAVCLISDSIKSMPLIVYERLDTGGKQRAEDYATYKILHRSPNPYTTPSRFKRQMVTWALLWGDGFAEIDRDRMGNPVGLYLIHPNRVKADVGKDGSVSWKVMNNGGTFTTISDEDMLHIMGASNDGVVGVSLIAKARDSLGLTSAAEAYGRRFFKNSSVPSGILEHPGQLKDTARESLRRSWEMAHGGENQGKAAILEEGMKFQPIGMPQKDAQFLETREFQVVEIARWFNIPPHKLKDLSRATYSNIEHQAIEYVQDCIMPWAVDFEEECDRKLISEPDRDYYFCEFLVDGLLRGDMASRYSAYATGRQWGWLSANDVRQNENMNPLPDDQGDMYLVPANMIAADQVHDQADTGNPTPDPSQTPPIAPDPVEPDEDDAADANEPPIRKLADSFVPAFADVFQRMSRKAANAATRAARQPATWQKWLSEFGTGHESVVASALLPTATACAEVLATATGGLVVPAAVTEAVAGITQTHVRAGKLDLIGCKTEADVTDKTSTWTDARFAQEAAEAVNRICEAVK